MKVNGPGFSLSASGPLGGAITASSWKGRAYFRTIVKPANPKSALQTSMRAMFSFLSQQWQNNSTAEQATWDAAAATLVVSPFNAYVRLGQRRWRNFLPPSKANPPAQTGTPGTFSTATATAGVRQITVTYPLATLSDNWGIVLYRALSSGFTPGIANVRAVLLADSTGDISYVDSPLTPDTYYYNAQAFTDDGVLGSALGEVSGTVV